MVGRGATRSIGSDLLFVDGIEVFYPVLKTDDIGNIGTICCSDGEYPEAVRAMAFNGAEVVYRPSEAIPTTGNSYPGGGWMKDLRTEVFRKMYELPIHPKNLWLEQDPLPHEKVDEIYRENIRCLIKRGSFTAPTYQFKGAHFQSGASSPEEEKWENIKTLWDGWGEEER